MLKTIIAAAWLFTAGDAIAQNTVGPMKQLADTGATKCVVAGAITGACTGTGQDAASGFDATTQGDRNGRAGFHYTAVCASGQDAGTGSCPAQPVVGTGPDQWACTRDEITGLLWELKTTDGSVRDQATLISMQNWGWGFATATDLRAALDAAAVCGSTAWDVPTPPELQSLVDYGRGRGKHIDADWFPNSPVKGTWGTAYPRDMPNEGTFQAISFASGKSKVFYPGDGRHARMVVRPAGLRTEDPRFVVVGADGAEVADRWSGLVWQRCAVGRRWNGSTCLGAATGATWVDMLALAATTPGWRLPNVKEVISLADLDEGLIDATAFPGRGPFTTLTLWTSTPAFARTDEAWQAFFGPGYANYWYRAAMSVVATAYLVRDR